VGEAGLEPDSVTAIQNNNLGNLLSVADAKSGAVPADAMLAALVAMLTPEQKAAFVAMLTAPSKPGG